MTAIDDETKEEWYDQQTINISFATKFRKLDERLSELFDQVQVVQAKIARHEYEEHGIDAERHKPKIIVTDAMLRAAENYIKDVLSLPGPICYAAEYEGLFRAMWEARDIDSDNK